MLGALIGAGSSLLGGFLGSRSKKKEAKREYARQKEFAQKGIQWRAADAEKAGISKLYALGANTTSYSPQSTGGDPFSSSIADAGQNIARAADAQNSNLGRAGHLAEELAKTQITGLQLDNDIKRSQLLSDMRLNSQPGNPPGHPDLTTIPHIPGQGNSTSLEYKKRLTPASTLDPAASAGITPEVDMYKSKHGFTPLPSQVAAEAMESMPFSALQWFWRNSIKPMMDDSSGINIMQKPPPGMKWQLTAEGDYKLRPIRKPYNIRSKGTY